jgi:hypothetical protein
LAGDDVLAAGGREVDVDRLVDGGLVERGIGAALAEHFLTAVLAGITDSV